MRNNRIPARYEEKIMIYDQRYAQQIKRFAAMEYNLGQMEEMKAMLNSPHDIDIHHAIIGLRKIITAERWAVEVFLAAQIIPRIMQLVLLESHPHVQHESMLILAIVAQGTRQQVAALVQLGAIKIFSQLIMCKTDKLVGQAAQSLSKISEFQIQFRDLVVDQVLPLINNRLSECIHEKRTFFKAICTTVDTIFDIDPKPRYQVIRQTVMILIDILESRNTQGVTHELFWPILYGSIGKEVCDRIVNSLAIYELLSGISSRPPQTLLAVLDILKNLIQEDTDNFKTIMSKNMFFLNELAYLFKKYNNQIQTVFLIQILEILEVTSEGDSKNIQILCLNRQLLTTLYKSVSDRDNQAFLILKVFQNFIHHGSIQSIEEFLKAGRIFDNFTKGDSQFVLAKCQCFYQLMLLRFRRHNLGNGIIMQTIRQSFDTRNNDFEAMLTKKDEVIVDIVERINMLMQRLQLQE